VKKAEPRDLRIVADSSSPAAAAFIVAPGFLPGPLAGSMALPGAGLLAGTGSWCSPNGSGTSPVQVVQVRGSEIPCGIALGELAFMNKKKLFTGNLSMQLKQRIVKSVLRSVALYAAESWTSTEGS